MKPLTQLTVVGIAAGGLFTPPGTPQDVALLLVVCLHLISFVERI